jgi:hypothetical protein
VKKRALQIAKLFFSLEVHKMDSNREPVVKDRRWWKVAAAVLACVITFLSLANRLFETGLPHISFYGRLEDQFGNALSNFPLRVEVSQGGFFNDHIVTTTVQSDERGYFEISGYKGVSLTILPAIRGYAWLSGNASVRFVHDLDVPVFVPDANRPELITLWKSQGAEPLLQIDHKLRLSPSDFPANIDLVAGTNVAYGGDIKLAIHERSVAASPEPSNSWGVTVEAIGGGVVDPRGELRARYFAPDSGYTNSLTFISGTNGNFDECSAELFLKSRGGHIYSHLWLSAFRNAKPPSNSITLELRGSCNTNSSRNFEWNFWHWFNERFDGKTF